MEKNIAVIWGDCSSPEIVKQTLRVLDKVAEKYGHTFHYTDAAMGGEAIDKYGDPLPQHELDKCLAADSVLLGAVGGPKWEGLLHNFGAGAVAPDDSNVFFHFRLLTSSSATSSDRRRR